MSISLRRAGSVWLVSLAAFGCGEGPSVAAVGQLRIHPAFAPGDDPDTRGIGVENLRIVVRRNGGSGAVVVDTTMPYESGATLSWLVDLSAPPESFGVTGELDDGGQVAYSGSIQASVESGIGQSIPVHDLPLQYVGADLVSVEVTPGTAALTAAGQTRQFQAVARDAGGAALSGFVFSWTSSDPSVATVNPASGLATAIGPGSATITATTGGVSGSATLTVAQISVIEVVPENVTLAALGATQQFTAVARDAQGSVIPGVSFVWASSIPTVATVDPATGLATAVGFGFSSITATVGGVSGLGNLTVTGAPPPAPPAAAGGGGGF